RGLADLWLFVTPTKRHAVCAQPYLSWRTRPGTKLNRQALWQLVRDTVHDFADVSHATEAIRDERRRLRAVDELTIEQHFGIDDPNGLGLIAELVARHGPSVFTSEGYRSSPRFTPMLMRANR